MRIEVMEEKYVDHSIFLDMLMEKKNKMVWTYIIEMLFINGMNY